MNDKTLQLFEGMQQQVMSGPGSLDGLWLFLGAVVVLLLVHFGARWSARRGKPRVRPSIDYLTKAVDVLGLSEEDRRDLLRLATGAQLVEPAALLLSPANLAHALRHPGNEPLEPELVARINRLSRRLFDAPLTAAVKGPGSSGGAQSR